MSRSSTVCSGVLLWWAVSGCSPDRAGCLTPLGETVVQSTALDEAVAAIAMEDHIDVFWRPTAGPGSLQPMVTVRAGEGVIGGVEVAVEDGVLHIADRNTCAWVRDLAAVPEVTIEGLQPESIMLWGQGDFTMLDTLTFGNLTVEGDEMAGKTTLLFGADTLKVRMPNGIGHVDVRGHARRFRAFRSGFGDLDARTFSPAQAMVHHAGVGDMILSPGGYLFLELAGQGDVLLWGDQQDWDIRILEGASGELVFHP